MKKIMKMSYFYFYIEFIGVYLSYNVKHKSYIRTKSVTFTRSLCICITIHIHSSQLEWKTPPSYHIPAAANRLGKDYGWWWHPWVVSPIAKHPAWNVINKSMFLRLLNNIMQEYMSHYFHFIYLQRSWLLLAESLLTTIWRFHHTLTLI